MWWGFLLCAVFASILLVFEEHELRSNVHPTQWGCIYSDDEFWWAVIVSICFGIAFSWYVFGITQTINMPPIVRRRTLLRGFSYLINFSITLFARAIWQITTYFKPGNQGGHVLDDVTNDLMVLNGAVNVGTYFMWLSFTSCR